MVDGPRKMECLALEIGLLSSLKPYFPILWSIKLPWALKMRHPMVGLSEALESSGLPVGFWSSRIATIRKDLIARLPRGGGSQDSWSSKLHAISSVLDSYARNQNKIV